MTNLVFIFHISGLLDAQQPDAEHDNSADRADSECAGDGVPRVSTADRSPDTASVHARHEQRQSCHCKG